MGRDPYCSHCGYSLVGLTESSKCPECGRPLVEVLTRPAFAPIGKRYTSPIVLFGLPLVHIAIGPGENERVGKARGIIAIGDIATGWFAFGGVARGLFAFGGLALGLVSFGGLGVGLLLAFGGAAVGGAAIGGAAVGGVATGGLAIGYVAQGGGAFGQYARGGNTLARGAPRGSAGGPDDQMFFDRWSWLLGRGPQDVYTLPIWMVGAALVFAALLAIVLLLAYSRRPRVMEMR